jgi:hypothetical protein
MTFHQSTGDNAVLSARSAISRGLEAPSIASKIESDVAVESGIIRNTLSRAQDLLDAGDRLADRLRGPDVQRAWPAEPLMASLIFASRPRGVELRFSSQGTLAQAGDWPKLDRGLARGGRFATF